MFSPITPPSTPILEGAGHLVVDYEPVPTVNTPPRSPILKSADRKCCILVTHGVEVTREVVVADKAKYEVKVTHEAEQVRDY
jgi:hypothetical protein